MGFESCSLYADCNTNVKKYNIFLFQLEEEDAF